MVRQRLALSTLIFITLVSFAFTKTAQAESITDFSSNININPDASFTVQETIAYDFGMPEKHGIYRTIPVRYTNYTGVRSIDINVIDVQRNGYDEPYEIKYGEGAMTIKIGDANKTISGSHAYKITYTVKRAINYFDNYDELYWNVTGNQWLYTIEASNVSVTFPVGTIINEQLASCYEGKTGSTSTCPINIKANTVTAHSNNILTNQEGLTIALAFPKNIVQQPSVIEKTSWWLKDNFIMPLTLLSVIIMLILWFTKGREPKGRLTIIPQYEPPQKLTPTLVGALIDGVINTRDLTAGIIWLAQQGYLRIERQATKGFLTKQVDYNFVSITPANTNTPALEKKLLEGLLGGGLARLLSTIKLDTKFSQTLKDIKDVAYEELKQRRWFNGNPSSVRISYLVFAGVFGVGAGIFSGYQQNIVSMICAVVAALLIGIIGWFMPQKTKLGAEIRDDILGFKQFLAVTDKERFKFHNAPEKNPKQFMEWLPYAIALGVETQWAEQFANMYIEPPQWYHSNLVGSILIADFMGNMSSFTASTTSGFQAASAKSGSGGHGFSGGGFGGGGGGSW
ncbi:MAG: DUF2207 domain-containing protein [Patescibacteria group bacterium]|jgi:uncharacterized membrane protein